jgi:hypothetical protein
VSPVNYGQGFYIPEGDIHHSHCSENLKSYNLCTVRLWKRSISGSPVRFLSTYESELALVVLNWWMLRSVAGETLLSHNS